MPAPLRPASIIFATFVLVGCHDAKRKVSADEAREVLGSEVVAQIPRWIRAEHLPPRARPGAHVFATSGCTTCHTYAGSGATNVGARDLSSAGRRHGARFLERYVAHPERYGNGVMPSFAALGRRRLHQLGIFLAASRGTR